MKRAYSTDDAPQAPAILSQAIVSDGLVFVAGQIHSTPDGKVINGTTEEKMDSQAYIKILKPRIENIWFFR
ncbi:MAG: hypothetical protein AAB541_01130 [Patescibacteria group bacterium]